MALLGTQFPLFAPYGTKNLHDDSRASRLELLITPNPGGALLMSLTLRGSWLGSANCRVSVVRGFT